MYNIRTEHLALIRTLEDNGGELTPELEQAMALTSDEFQEKAISYGFVVKSFDDVTAAIDNEIGRLNALKAKSVKRGEAFKSRLDEAMRQFKVEKIVTPTLTLCYRKSSPLNLVDGFEDNVLKYARVSIVWDAEKVKSATEDDLKVIQGADVDLLDYFDVSPSISKKRLTEAIKAGKSVPGVSLEEKKNLQIK